MQQLAVHPSRCYLVRQWHPGHSVRVAVAAVAAAVCRRSHRCMRFRVGECESEVFKVLDLDPGGELVCS